MEAIGKTASKLQDSLKFEYLARSSLPLTSDAVLRSTSKLCTDMFVHFSELGDMGRSVFGEEVA